MNNQECQPDVPAERLTPIQTYITRQTPKWSCVRPLAPITARTKPFVALYCTVPHPAAPPLNRLCTAGTYRPTCQVLRPYSRRTGMPG